MDLDKKWGCSHSSPPAPPPYPKAGSRPRESLCLSWQSLVGVFLEWPPTLFSGGIGDTTEHTLTPFWGFPSGFPRSLSPACQRRKHWLHPCTGKIPRRRKWQPIPVFSPGKSHGQGSLVGYICLTRKGVIPAHQHPPLWGSHWWTGSGV